MGAGNTNKIFLRTKDFSVTGEDFELYHKEELDMLVTRPQPQNLSRYYASEDYISHTDSDQGFVNNIYQRVKKYNLRKKVRLIDSLTLGKKSLLDVGAGTGDFLLAAREAGWKVRGVEPNPAAQERATAKGISLLYDLEEIRSEKFQTVTLWHVLEHLPNMEEQLRKLVSLMEDTGSLVVAVPNFKSYDAVHYGKFWAAYDVPRHLWHFSRTSIEKLFLEHSLKVVKTKPMVFDAFYVSLLSEKYKRGKQHFVKAFLVGLVSNMLAWGSKEYSSIVYVLKKGQ